MGFDRHDVEWFDKEVNKEHSEHPESYQLSHSNWGPIHPRKKIHK